MSTGDQPLPQDKPRSSRDVTGEAPRHPLTALNSQQLLRGQKSVDIEHNGERYRLQNTRAGKLILTK